MRGVLRRVLSDVLALLHPFIPFQTEVLWQVLHEALGSAPDAALIVTRWPTSAGLGRDDKADERMALLQELVRAVRNIRSVTMVGEKKPLDAIVNAPSAADRAVLSELEAAATNLGFLNSLVIADNPTRPASSAVGVAGGLEVFVPLGADVDLDKLVAALDQRVVKTQKLKEGTAKKLSNQAFVERADPEIVEAERERLNELGVELELLERNLAGLRA